MRRREQFPFEHEVWPREGREDLAPHEITERGFPWDKNGKLRAGMEKDFAWMRDYYLRESAEIEAECYRFAERLEELK